jgi:hypothetical protein
MGGAHAAIITHNGLPVFQDGFEAQSVGASPSTTNVTPGPGNWVVNSGSDTAATLGSGGLGPGAVEGSQYLKVERAGEGGVYVGREILPVTTGQVHVEMMVHQNFNSLGEGSVHFNAGWRPDSEGLNSEALLHLYSDAGNRIRVYDTPEAFADSHFLQSASGGNMTYQFFEWQKWEVDIDMDAATYVVTIDGQASTVEPLLQTDGTLQFFGTRATLGPSLAYFDGTNTPMVPHTSFEWSGATPGAWEPSINWAQSGGPPDGQDVDVTFGGRGSGGTVATDQSPTANHITFDYSDSYFIAGGGSVNLARNSGGVDPVIEVVSGIHEFQVKVNLGADTNVDGGSALDFNNQIDLAGNRLTTSGKVNINNGVMDSGNGGSISSLGTLGTAGSTGIDADLTSTGTLHIDLGQHNVDHFNVTGTASIAGSTIDISLDNFTPDPQQQFTILSAAGGLGGLASNQLTLSGDNAGFSVNVSGSDVILEFGSGGLVGDYSGNGIVDAADYVVWRDGDSPDSGPQGYLDWKVNFGNTAGSGATAAVPEPASLVLYLLACVLPFLRTRDFRER